MRQVASEVLVAHDDGVLVEEAVDGPDVLLVDLLRVAHLVKELWVLLNLPLGIDDAVQLLLHLLEEVVWECRPLGVFGLFRRLHLKNYNGHLNGALNSRSRMSEPRGGDLHHASERPTRGQHGQGPQMRSDDDVCDLEHLGLKKRRPGRNPSEIQSDPVKEVWNLQVIDAKKDIQMSCPLVPGFSELIRGLLIDWKEFRLIGC